jgi:hypothetical protein
MSLDNWDAPNGEYTQVIPPGVKAIREGAAAHFGIELAFAQVIRAKSRCDADRSEHCECGAIDLFPPNEDFVLGRRMFDFFVANEDVLGIQSVIFNRRVIGFGNTSERDYTGENPHVDHVHVGVNREARQSVTPAMVEECLAMEQFMTFTEAELANLRELAAVPPAALAELAALPPGSLQKLAALSPQEIGRLVKLAGDFDFEGINKLGNLAAFMIEQDLSGEATGRPALLYDALRDVFGVQGTRPDALAQKMAEGITGRPDPDRPGRPGEPDLPHP